MADLEFIVGRPGYDWTSLLDNVLRNGALSSTNNTPQTQIDLVAGDAVLIISGTALTANGARSLTGGTIISLSLVFDGQEVARFDNYGAAKPVSTLQAALNVLNAPVPDQMAYNAALNTLFRAEALNVVGSGQDDRAFGSLVGGDTVNLGNGDDEIVIGGGATSFYDGGNGFDFLLADFFDPSGIQIDYVEGTVHRANDYALLANFDNFEGMFGGTGNDWVRASSEPNGSFFFGASGGYDVYLGGGTHDEAYARLSYLELAQRSGFAGGIVVNLASGTVEKSSGGGTDTVWGLDTIRGTNSADTFTGDVFDNEFQGMNGADSFSGSGGWDGVNYEDEAYQSGGIRGVFINLSGSSNTGNATGFTTVTLAARTGLDAYGNLDTFSSIENIVGTRYNDRLVGDEKDNHLRGREGNDRLLGASGRDHLDGDDGNDYIDGGSGRDQLHGGRGNDTILGGLGDDNIDGGEGNDTIAAGTGQFDNISGSSGTDTVDGEAGFDMYAFDQFDRNEDTNDDGNHNEHGADAITVTLGGGIGAGSLTGHFGINSTNPSPVAAAVSTSFTNLERIRGTVGNDVFNVGTGFSNTEDANTSFDDIVRGSAGVFELVGGDGADTFNDAAKTGLTIINYDEEKWSHPDFNDDDDRRWGDLGELGVAINASNSTRALGGFGNVAANRAIDTWGDLDVLNGVNAFRMTDAVDYFYGGSQEVYVEGRGGEDNFNGGNGNDQFNGGDANDTGRGGAGHDKLNGDDGNDVLRGDGGNDELNGQSGNDTLSGDAGNDRLHGDDGNDVLNGNDGRDYLQGGSDDDIADGGAGDDQVRGDDGSDTVRGGTGDDEVEGGNGDDNVYGDDGDDRLRGGWGNDLLVGGLGDDRIDGHEDNDIIYGDDEGSSNVLGGQDRIYAGSGNDSVSGGYGDDEIRGDDGTDTLNGGYGDDDIAGGSEADTLNGDAGEDRLFGDDGNDTVNGGSGDDLLDGGDDNDTLNGGSDDDFLAGGNGNDVLDGGSGNDSLQGGFGDDSYILGSEATGMDTIFDQEGVDTIRSSISRNLSHFVGIENLTLEGSSGISGTGDSFDNVITGNSGANILNGNDGADTLLGAGGNDTLNGGTGDDILVGGVGRDTMTGGVGNDTYRFTDLLDMGSTTSTRDIITDFSKIVGDQDLIDLSGVDANSLAGGDQAFIFNATKGAGFSGLAGSLVWTQLDQPGTVDDRTVIRGDVDGDSVLDFQIQITGLVTLTGGDFLL